MNVRGLLRLLRPPNVFTAFADSLAGFFIVAGFVCDRRLLLVAASGCLYLGGLVLNDVFDLEIDRQERPKRPLPSGEVSLMVAMALGGGLLAAGVILALAVSMVSCVVAMAIALAVLAYDGGLKNSRFGPWGMGACRFLNFTLGLSAAGTLALPVIAWIGPLVIGLYIVALTYVARDEVGGNSAERAHTGLRALAAIALGEALAFASVPTARHGWAVITWAAVVGLGVTVWGPLWKVQDGPNTRRAIGGGILMIPLIDASVVAALGPVGGILVVAALAVPAMILRRWFSPT